MNLRLSWSILDYWSDRGVEQEMVKSVHFNNLWDLH